MRTENSRPGYNLHKPSGNAYTRIDGRQIYLGRWDSPESRSRYRNLLEDWSTRHEAASVALTVDELSLRYFGHVGRHYRTPDGRETSEVALVRLALRPLIQAHGRTRAREFGPVALKAVRSAMIEQGWTRKSINTHVGRIRRMIKWAASEELLPVTVYHALATVSGLRAGRSAAKESPPVRPVSWDQVEAVGPHVSRQVWGAIRLQWLTGMRSQEVLSMRGSDLVMSGTIWEYEPETHKTAHHGKTRTIFLGPEAQAVVREFLKTDLQAYLFSAADAEDERFAAMRAKRKTSVQPSQVDRSKSDAKKRPGDRYTTCSYGQAIRKGCLKAKIEPWHPHQLRHSAATRIRREAGIETARVVLGHSSVAMTELYAEADRVRAAEIMGRIG